MHVKKLARRICAKVFPNALNVLVVSIFAILLLYPLFMLFYGSLGEAQTYQHYIDILGSVSNLEIILNTFLLSFGSATLAMLVGTSLAWFTTRTDLPFRGLFESLFVAPFFISPLLTAMAWVLIAGPKGIINFVLGSIFGLDKPLISIYSIWGMILVQSIFFTPMLYLFASSALKSMDPALEDASRTSGANTLQTFLRITLPLIRPSILAGFLLAFVGSLSMFSVPVMLGRPYHVNVITTRIWELLTYYPVNHSLAAALSAILFVVTSIGLYIYRRMVKGSEKYVTITGKGFRPRLIELGRLKKVVFLICACWVVFSFGMPLLALGLTSFLRYFTLESPTFTLSNYIFVLMEHPLTLRAILNSILLAASGASLCILLTTVVSIIIIRTKIRGRVILDFMSMIPASVPSVTFAVALLWAWIAVPLPIYGTGWILLISYVTLRIPYGVRFATSGLRQIDPELEESSRLCNSSSLRTMLKITFPLMKPSLVAGWIMIFVLLLREIGSSLLLYSYKWETISVVLFDMWSEGSIPWAAAMSVILLLISMIFLVMIKKVAGVDLSKAI